MQSLLLRQLDHHSLAKLIHTINHHSHTSISIQKALAAAEEKKKKKKALGFEHANFLDFLSRFWQECNYAFWVRELQVFKVLTRCKPATMAFQRGDCHMQGRATWAPPSLCLPALWAQTIGPCALHAVGSGKDLTHTMKRSYFIIRCDSCPNLLYSAWPVPEHSLYCQVLINVCPAPATCPFCLASFWCHGKAFTHPCPL